MTREQKIEAFTMRLDGASYQKIADRFDVSKQCIHQLLFGVVSSKSVDSRINRYKFPNIIKWMDNNSVTLKEFGDKVIPGKGKDAIYRKLSGKSSFTMKEVQTVLDVTGMTFEEAFETE